jgi:hypothetical protein
VTLGAWSTACDLIFAFMRPSQHSSNEPVSARKAEAGHPRLVWNREPHGASESVAGRYALRGRG